MDTSKDTENGLNEAVKALGSLADVSEDVVQAGEILVHSLKDQKKVLFCGNGGSAAHAQHFAAELMGKFLLDREPLSALSLTVDTSALTAIANDIGYEQVFARQLKGLGRAGDSLVALSTSGTSKNIIAVLKLARRLGIHTVGISGPDGGKMTTLCDVCIKTPAHRTDHIQNAHMIIGHLLCDYVERKLC